MEESKMGKRSLDEMSSTIKNAAAAKAGGDDPMVRIG